MHPRIRFVGGESPNQRPATSRSPSWTFYQAIDIDGIYVGANISILKYHPLHQGNIDPSLSNFTLYSQSVLLEGTILGIRDAKEGVVTYFITNDFADEITTIRIPASATTIEPSGGWITKAKPLRYSKGPIIYYPTLIRAQDLRPPPAHRRPTTGNRWYFRLKR